MSPDIAFCLETPAGELVAATMRKDRSSVWFAAYDIERERDPEWGNRFWKRYPASAVSLSKRGYKVRMVRLVKCYADGSIYA